MHLFQVRGRLEQLLRWSLIDPEVWCESSQTQYCLAWCCAPLTTRPRRLHCLNRKRMLTEPSQRRVSSANSECHTCFPRDLRTLETIQQPLCVFHTTIVS